MPIPDFQTVMLPLLQHTADDAEHTLPETEDYLAKYFKITEEERNEMLSSGKQSRFDNRVGWAKQHLMKAGMLESPRRSIFKISNRGKEVLRSNPERINMAFLRQYPEYLEFIRPSNNETVPKETSEELEIIEKSPKEILDDAYQRLRKALQQELLDRVRQSHWRFFEKLVVELLVKMDYGGSVKDAGQMTRPTNDEGIDGVIKEDKLGLDVIYLQAKRYEADKKVGRPDIQSFVGALEEKRAMKGVFITTSSFVSTANDYVKNISKKVILIDGEQLAGLMIDYGIGVSNRAYKFNGSTNYIQPPPLNSFNVNKISLGIWLRTDIWKTYAGMFCSRAGNNLLNGLELVNEGGSKRAILDLMHATDFHRIEFVDSTLADNQWHFLVGTFNGNSMKLYLDGELVSQASVSFILSVQSFFKIGTDDIFGTQRSFQGDLDDAFIYP